MDRKPISSLFGKTLGIRQPRDSDPEYSHGTLLLYRRDNGQIVAQLDGDDLFDKDGLRFTDDT